MQSELMKEEDKVETPSAEDKVEVAAEDKVESPFVDDQPEAAAVAEDVDAAGVKDEVAVEAEGKPETDVAEDEAKVAAQNTKQRWYVVHAYSGFESYVKKVLESRIATSEHKDKFGSIMVPTEEVVEMREGNRRKSERKFFPGYVLVQMEMDSDTWQGAEGAWIHRRHQR
jgi:hypothetical protein